VCASLNTNNNLDYATNCAHIKLKGRRDPAPARTVPPWHCIIILLQQTPKVQPAITWSNLQINRPVKTEKSFYSSFEDSEVFPDQQMRAKLTTNTMRRGMNVNSSRHLQMFFMGIGIFVAPWLMMHSRNTSPCTQTPSLIPTIDYGILRNKTTLMNIIFSVC